jgi:hypothetical protein
MREKEIQTDRQKKRGTARRENYRRKDRERNK